MPSSGRAFGYIRVSHYSESDGSISPETQRSRIEAAAISRSMKFIKHFEDLDISGAEFSRPGLTELMRTIEAGDTVITIESSRLGRGVYKTLGIIQDFDALGINVWCLDNNFDTGTDAGKLALHMMLSIDEFERNQTRTRTQNAKKEARRIGRWCGGTTPLGYERGTNRGSLIENVETAAIVRRVFELRASGMSFPEISDSLFADGIGGVRSPRMSHSAIQVIVHNPLYVGQGRWAGEPYQLDPECVPPLITKELWDAVQAVEAKRTRGRGSSNRYLLSGMMTCSLCGSPMARRIRYKESYSKQKGKGHKTISAVDYFCFSAHNAVEAKRRGLKPCKGVMFREHIAEKELTESLFNYINDELLKLEVAEHEPEEIDDSNNLPSLRTKLANLRGREARLLDLYADGNITREVLDGRVEAVREQTEIVEKKITDLETGRVLRERQINEIKAFSSLREEWSELTVTEQRALIKIFVSSVFVKKCQSKDEKRLLIEWK